MILVTGDAMVDRYWFGTVTRVSPEAPVPVLSYGRLEEREGGAANVALNARAMGADVVTVFSPSYEEDPVVKLRLIARTQQIARVDFDSPQKPVSLDEIRRAAKVCRTVILSDYAKGALGDAGEIIEVCHQAGATVLVDPKGSDPGRYSGADVIKPNHQEMEALVGRWTDEEDLERKACELCVAHGIGAVLMTRGEVGMSLFIGSRSWHVPGKKLDLYDVSGAGDTAIAALAVALEQGLSLPEAMMRANSAAGVAVSRFGTTVVSWKEVFA